MSFVTNVANYAYVIVVFIYTLFSISKYAELWRFDAFYLTYGLNICVSDNFKDVPFVHYVLTISTPHRSQIFWQNCYCVRICLLLMDPIE
jgi:hypothetical protein